MAGLLDFEDPQSAGLLGLAQGLLAAGGPSTHPVSLGQAIATGMQGYQVNRKAALDQQKEAMQMDMLKQQIAAATRKNNLINDMLAQYGGGDVNSAAASQALAEGAKVGDIGPTVGNAARMNAITAQQPQGAGMINGVPRQAIAHDLAFNDGKNVSEWLYKQGVPDMQVANGYAYDKNKLQAGFLPGVHVSQNGQASLTMPNAQGTVDVSAPKGAMETFGGYKDIEKRTDAKYNLLPLDYASRDGRPLGGSVLGYLDGQSPGAPAAAASMGGAQGLDTSKLTKQQIAFLQSQNPEAFANGVEHFKVTAGATPQAMAPGSASGLQSPAEKAREKGMAELSVEREKERPTAHASLQSTIAGLDSLAAEARAIMNDPALGRITGQWGRFPNAPGSDASNVAARLETLRSKTGFNVLQAMREASKTGGALGSVSERENTLLQNNLAALDTTQSHDAFKNSLQEIIDYADRTKGRLGSAFKDTYGVEPEAPAAPKSKGWQDYGYANQQAAIKDAQNVILRNPSAKAAVIKRLQDMGIQYPGGK